ncbi:MAG: FHA domain-containing protein [Shinella sp.]|uniref:FHA domain-containing protein n=1 Tax=Shinella sp. TaxID=1870904 RepID=UPI004035DB0E
MAASGSADIVLKILSGVQSGVDIVLAEGEYAVGSGSADDIQIFDVSLSAAHLRIVIRQGKIEIAGGTGSLKTGNGFALEAGGDFQEIEPLDIVTAGTSRFALGPTTANWSSVVDVGGLSEQSPATPPKPGALSDLAILFSRPGRKALLPVAAVLLLAMAVFAMSYSLGWDKTPERQEAVRTDLELVDASLGKFPFAKRLATRQEIDGTVFVTGYVTSPVERRAALAAIRDAGIAARVRISVTDLIRNEVANFLDSESSGLTFALSDTGVLSLDGVMLDADRLNQLTETLKERVMGVASITSNVRTGASLLSDVQALAERSKIVPLVLLRRDNDLIEASGVIPTDKIDAWAGFLQAYSTQLAPIIPLRSLVFLQDPSKPEATIGIGDDKALYLGAGTGQGGDVSVDVNRLKAGSFDLSDIFVGQPRQVPGVGALGASASGSNAGDFPNDGRPTVENAAGIDLKATDDKAPYLGPGTRRRNDVNRLKADNFGLSDVFAGQSRQVPGAGALGLSVSGSGSCTGQGSDVSVDVNRLTADGSARSDTLVGKQRQMPGSEALGTAVTRSEAGGLPSDGRPTGENADASEQKTTTDKALYLDPGTRQGDDATRPTADSSGLSDIFGGKPRQVAGSEALGTSGSTSDAGDLPNDGRPTGENARAVDRDRKTPVRMVGTPFLPAAEDTASSLPIPGLLDSENSDLASASPGILSEDELATMARRLLEDADNGTFDASENGAALKDGIKALEEADPDGDSAGKTSLPARYERMLASLRSTEADARQCWQGSRLTRSNALGTLFWLDLLSVTNQLSLSTFSPQSQELMFEAALNPEMTGRCVEQADGTRPSSVYLREVSQNPEFVRHILRDIEPYALDVSGVSLAGERYVQTRGGAKLRQGAAPDEGSRILTVGELGMALERQSGYASVIFNDTLNWLTR